MQLKKPVSEIIKSGFYLTQKLIEKLKLLHLNDQVSWGGSVDPLAGLFMHIGTQGGEINKLPMSLHPTTPNWLRWSCGIHLLWHGKSLNAATSKKRWKRQQFFSLTFKSHVMGHWRARQQWSQLNLLKFCILSSLVQVNRQFSNQGFIKPLHLQQCFDNTSKYKKTHT